MKGGDRYEEDTNFLMVMLACIMLTGFFSMTAEAAESRVATVNPYLSFSGTTANCSVSVTAFGKDISVTMQLCQGDTVLKTWYGSGRSVVSLSEEKSVVRGNTYTLKVSGTIGGEAFDGAPVTCKCN